jgi:hypothetical protein
MNCSVPLPVMSLLKRATSSGAFVSYKYQPRRYLSVRVFIKPIFRQMRHWQWHILVKTPLTVTRFSKNATDSDAFQ